MKPCPALAAFEFDDIPTGVAATDALLKRAPIAFFRCGTITDGRYLTVIGGTTASVGEAAEETLRYAGPHLLDHVILPDVHPRLYEGVLGKRHPRVTGSLAIVECATVSACIKLTEAALKGTRVELIEIRLADSGLAGKSITVIEGTLYDIEAAVSLAVGRQEESPALLRVQKAGSPTHVTGGLSYRIIAAPHDATNAQVSHGTGFSSSLLIELEGERL